MLKLVNEMNAHYSCVYRSHYGHFFNVFLHVFYLRHVNEVNGGDNAFVCVCLSVCVCVCVCARAQRPVMGDKC